MTSRIAWITGASSGMGRATALALSADGWTMALTARRTETLDDVAGEIQAAGGSATVFPGDLAVPGAATDTAEKVTAALGPVRLAVFSAGLNTKRRMWDSLDPVEFRRILEVNLSSVAEATSAVLPSMRARGIGQLVLISSWAAWRHSPGAGVAYAASKTALGAIAETVNAQEGRHGIRACHLCPGDVDTDFLSQRPAAVSAEARTLMLSPDDIARAVSFVASSPASVCVNELVITPTANASYR